MSAERPKSEREIQEHIKGLHEENEVSRLTSEEFYREREEVEKTLERTLLAFDQKRYEKSSSREGTRVREQEDSAMIVARQQVESFARNYGLKIRVDWEKMRAPEIIEEIERAHHEKLDEARKVYS